MGNVAWEKTVREVVPVSQIGTGIIIFFLGASSKWGTLAGLVRSALNRWPSGPGSRTREPGQLGHALVRYRSFNGTNLLLLKTPQTHTRGFCQLWR